MKTITIIVFFLCSIGMASAQTDFLTGKESTANITRSMSHKDSIDILGAKSTLNNFPFLTGSIYSNSSVSQIGSILEISAAPKKVMVISYQDLKTGEYHIWIDPKRIVWTSDSTFTLNSK